MSQWQRVGTQLNHRKNKLESRNVSRRILNKAKGVEYSSTNTQHQRQNGVGYNTRPRPFHLRKRVGPHSAGSLVRSGASLNGQGIRGPHCTGGCWNYGLVWTGREYLVFILQEFGWVSGPVRNRRDYSDTSANEDSSFRNHILYPKSSLAET